MRVISGTFKGRRLTAPAGLATRPTADRAREALFNVIEHAGFAPALQGARVLDLYAGSGALGFEALSRGAEFCLFVETSEEARGAIRDTIEAFGLFGQTRIHRRDAARLGPRPASAGPPFRMAFMDPPYRANLCPPTVQALLDGGWLAQDALLVCELAADEADLQAPGLQIRDVRIWGAAKVVFATTPSGG